MELKMKWRLIKDGAHYFLEYKKFLFWHSVKPGQALATNHDPKRWDIIYPDWSSVGLAGFCSREIAEDMIEDLDKSISCHRQVIREYEPRQKELTYDEIIKREG